MNQITKFNIRVYGIAINGENEVLVTDELHFGMKMTKFPGGGLKIGEGTKACLHREFLEEMNQKINVIEHFYTTDFYQETELIPDKQQLISIYYKIELVLPINFHISLKPFDFKNGMDGEQSFRWIKIKELNENDLTFPIDKILVNLIKEIF